VALRLGVSFLTKARGIIFIPLVTKALGVHGYGVFSQITITVTFLLPIVTLGLRESCVKYVAGEKDKTIIGVKFATINSIVFVALLLTLVVGFFLREHLSFWFFSEDTFVTYIYWLLLLVFVRANYYVARSLYRALNKVLLYSALEIIQISSEVGIVLCFYYLNHISISIVLASFVAVETVIYIVITFDILRLYGVKLPDIQLAKKLLKYGLPLMFGTALLQFVDVVDRFFIVHFLGIKKVAVYAATYNLSKIMLLFVSAIVFPLFPLIIRYWKENDKNKLNSLIGMAIKIYCFLVFPLMFGFFRIYPQLIVKLTTKAFMTDPHMVLLLLGAFFLVGLSYMFHFIIHASNRTYIFAVLLAFITMVNMLLNYWLIPAYEIVGAAFATLVSYGIYFLILCLIARHIFPWSWPGRFMVYSAVISACMYIFLNFIPCETIVEILANCILGGLFYVIGWGVVASLNGYSISELTSKMRLLKGEIF
jgi:O-antigen/teichoic acid export membrane protein